MMLDNLFLEKINASNKDYQGKMRSLTFVVKSGDKEKKIFKWLFEPSSIDFFVALPYFKSEIYYCGLIEIPGIPNKNEVFDLVKDGKVSEIPVKFSYHEDGKVHFKQSNFEATAENRWEKLAELDATPLTKLNGDNIFTIRFEGLDKFSDLNKHRGNNGDREVLLTVPEDIINFDIQAYAGPTEASIDGRIKEGSIPWFQVQGKSSDGIPVFVGVYAILSRKSHILDKNKNGLHVLVGFDRSKVSETGRIRSLYLFAR